VLCGFLRRLRVTQSRRFLSASRGDTNTFILAILESLPALMNPYSSTLRRLSLATAGDIMVGDSRFLCYT